MAIKAFADLNCSVARPLAFLGERWALLVLRDLFLGRRRFDEFQESLGIATRTMRPMTVRSIGMVRNVIHAAIAKAIVDFKRWGGLVGQWCCR